MSWEIRSAGTFLVKCTQLFPRFHSQKPRTNLPTCIQIQIALSFADIPCGVPSLLCFAITGPRQHLLVRNSDAATTSTLLDSRCWISFTGPLQPFPPRTPKAMRTQSRLSEQNDCLLGDAGLWRDLRLFVGRGGSFAGFSFVLLRRLSFEVPQAGNGEGDDDEGSSVNSVVEKNVHRAFYAVSL